MKHFILLFASLLIVSLSVNAQIDDEFSGLFNDSTSNAPPIIDITPPPPPDQGPEMPGVAIGDFRSQTPGGIGQPPRGNNFGKYLHTNFEAAFPNGLTVGIGEYSVTFTSAQAITDFVPSSGGNRAIGGNYLNPRNKEIKNTLLMHAIAAKITSTFDVWDADFSGSSINTKDLVLVEGELGGKTLSEILLLAERALGGQDVGVSYSTLNTSLAKFNEAFVDGEINTGAYAVKSSETKALLIGK